MATTIDRDWRLRIHDAGTTTPTDLTVAHTFIAEIKDPPEVGGQTVRVLDGRSESQPWQVTLVDDAGALTSVLGDANDRAQLGYRIADIAKRDDGGAWDILATGRVSSILLDEVAGYVVSVQDERLIERNTTLFKGVSDSTTIYSSGFAAGSYGPFSTLPLDLFGINLPAVEFQRGSHSGDATIVGIFPAHNPDLGTSGLLDLIKDDVKEDANDIITSPSTATSGSYRTLRLRMEGESTDREIIGFEYFTLVFTNRDGRLKQLSTMWVYDPANDLATGRGYLYMPTADPSDELPLHIESRPGDLLESIYDGTYSDAAVRYDSTAMTTLKNRLQDDGVGSLRWRIKGTANMARWLEDNIYKPLGVVPLIGADGAVKPVKVWTTHASLSDPNTLHEFTESNCKLLDWHHAAEEAVSIVRGKYPQEVREPYEDLEELYEAGRSLDSLSETDHEHEETHDTVADADRVMEIDLRGWHDKNRVAQFMRLRSREVFEMFGDGPLRASLWAGSASESVDAGDYVVVNHAVMPSPTGNRGDSRICFVLSRTALANGFNFDLIEVGPSLQPLAAPTISVVQNGNGADVTVSSLATNADWELRIHEGDSATEPADSDTGWRSISVIDNATTTYTVAKIKHGVTVWFEARARRPGRIPSDWSAGVSLSITALTAPSALAVSEQGGAFVKATFTKGEDLPTEVHLNGTLQFTLPTDSESLTVRGLATSTTYNSPGLQVRHIDPQTGAVSAFDTVTFTTTATAETAPDYIAAALIVGESG